MSDPATEDNEYLLSALEIMEENSLRRHEVDWQALAQETLALKIGRHAALRFALERVDRHSFLHVPYETEVAQPAVFPPPTGHLLSRGTRTIAVVIVPACMGASQEEIHRFAQDLRRIIGELLCSSPDGWIVDLRKNLGGNMWPMLLGLGPLLGTGVLGYFDDGQSQLGWFYRNSAVGVREEGGDEHVLCQIEFEQTLDNSVAPVAVLIGEGTQSSGEALTVAFRGRNNTWFIGEKTNGLSSSNRPFLLSDGAEMWLTVAFLADRNGVRYEFGVEPDHEVKDDSQGDDDPVILAAMEYLLLT